MFWTQNNSDPWGDKLNDHIEGGCSVDYVLIFNYYLFSKLYKLYIRPYGELFGMLNWDKSSSYRSFLTYNLGIWIKLTSNFRVTYNFGNVLLKDNDFRYNNFQSIGVRIKF